MKQEEDKVTPDLYEEAPPPPAPKPKTRGRPASGSALTGKERQKARRERLAATGVGTLTVELPMDVLDGLNEYLKFKGITKNVVIEKLIRQQLLRKR